MAKALRMTMATRAVLNVLLEDPTRERYGLEVCADAGLPSGTIHPIMARLEAAGWVESSWEEIDPRVAGRPARRYYRLTAEGAASARTALAAAERALSRHRPGPAVGQT